MAHVISTRDQVFKLREEGYSYKHISEKTGISKSTLSGWLSGVPYTPNQETIDRIGKARAISGHVKAKLKLESIKKAEQEATSEIGKITKRDLFILGLGLYIGEGTKTHNIVRIINSDPKIIRFAVKWFEKAFGLSKANFRIRLHLYPDNNIKECMEFWSKTSGISLSQFQKTQIDERKNKKVFKRGKLPHGTAHLAIKSNGRKEFGVFLARKINALIGKVLK